MQIAYQLSQQEYSEAYRSSYWRKFKRNFVRNIILSFAAVFLISLGFMYHLNLIKASIFTLLFVPFFYLFYVPFISVYLWFCGRWQFKKEPKYQEQVLWDFKIEEVYYKSSFSEGTLKWNAFSEFAESSKVFMLYTTSWFFYIVPKRAFKNQEEDQAFKSLLMEKIGKK